MVKETQHHFLRIHSSLGDDALVLESLNACEGLSRLFDIWVIFTANERIEDMKPLIGEPVSVSLVLGDNASELERFFHGHFLSVRELGKPLHNGEGQRYQAQIVPRAWSATSRTNCRIFQDQTALDIVETILGEHSVSLKNKLNNPLYTYRYCVQYGETDWEFVCRILAHEGLAFFFEHTSSSHTMVITDNEKAYAKAAEAEVVFSSRPRGEARISNWYCSARATSNAIVEHGYDFTRPADKVDEKSQETVPGDPFGERELFDYIGEDRPLKDKAGFAGRHLQAVTQENEMREGQSDYRSFGAGLMFSFSAHEDGLPSPNEFLITEVRIQASVPLDSDNQPNGARFNYSNTFRCMPLDRPFVPAKIAKPVMPGLQTATVTCAPGEEIHVDEHGRIKVQFHWDREGKSNQYSSCWIRVAQSWAGENWGAQFIPREGQEVLVEFVNGDPDQPLITGAVYNGKNKMPYEPMSEKNTSGIKSRSTTKGNGANYNEISFDDTLGNEWLRIHAEKDHELTVENDQTDDVGNNRLGSIGNNDTLKVGNDQKISVGKTITVDAGTSITFKTGAASLTMESSGNISIKGTSISVQGTTIALKAAKISLN